MLVVSIASAFLHNNNLTKPEDGLERLASLNLSSLSDSLLNIALNAYVPLHSIIDGISGNQDHATYPILIVLFLLLSYLIYQRINDLPITLKSIIVFMVPYFFIWWLLGAGAPWYGLLLFCLPYVFFVYAMAKPDKEVNTKEFWLSKNGILISASVIWTLFIFAYRTSDFNPSNERRGKILFSPPVLQYQTGQIDKNTSMDAVFPEVRQITNIINRSKSGNVYRVGTQTNFFIEKNDSRVLNDTFLDFFNRLVLKYGDKSRIIQVLKEQGFKYIVVELNMPAFDYTPEKSLTRKFLQFMNTLYRNPQVTLVKTNRQIELKENGQIVNAVFEDVGRVVNYGNIALCEIK